MRNTFLLQPVISSWALSIRTAISILAYRAMMAMRVLSPYLFAGIFVVLAPGARAATPAEIFVQQNIDRGYVILNDATLPPQERSAQFRALLTSIMDSQRVGLFTLGPYARTATDMEVLAFSNSFADFMTARLQHDLAGNPGESVTVTGSVTSRSGRHRRHGQTHRFRSHQRTAAEFGLPHPQKCRWHGFPG